MSPLATPSYLSRSLDDLEGSTISTSLQGLASDCICMFFSQLAAGRTITTRFNVLEEQAVYANWLHKSS